MSYKLGIDIGSTTLKTVVLDDQDQILFKSYERHLSKVREATVQAVKKLSSVIEDKQVKVAVTGSAGLGMATACGLEFVQEVYATAVGVKKYYPQADVVIELGGEDAKILYLKGAMEERMNNTCAGGTGSFIDQMATLLNVSAQQLDELCLKHKNIYPIASRCGVFAKTDIQALMNQGASKEDIAASIFQAIVSQTIAGLAQGRPIEGTVLFLGGPLAFCKGLQQRFAETLGLDKEHAVFPELSQYFVALSCACYANDLMKTYTYKELLESLQNPQKPLEHPAGLDPLFASPEEYEVFQRRHKKADVKTEVLSAYAGDAYLGIDAGSTTTKLVLIGADNQLLYSHYCPNPGNPLPIVQEVLAEIYKQGKERIKIRGSAVTGYGEDLIQNAFDVDFGVVETVAHYYAASYFNPDVDFIIDIGGQDIKCFEIKDHAINSVMLNEACSSGCGSFLSTFARSLGYSIQDFVKLAIFSKHPVDLGTRCTVFMNSSVKQAQKNGAGVEDISAGLAVSVVKNAIYKVIRASNANALGKNIVVQGGTFLNDAVLRSFEMLIGRNVTRPQIAGLMGAYGAALYAKKNQRQICTLISCDELNKFTHSSKVIACNHCTNHCKLTVNTFANGNKFISGNRCETPVRKNEAKKLPNLYEYKLKKLTSLKSKIGRRGKIGIPLVLNMYENLPFWIAFFDTLDYTVVVSDVSDAHILSLGRFTIPSDTICYPAKLVHGHIMNLVEKGADTIFYPCMSYNFEEGNGDNHFNCPVVAYYPEVIQANVTLPENVRFLYPYLDFNNKKLLAEHLFKLLHPRCSDLKKSEVKNAVKNAYAAYTDYRKDIATEGQRALEYAWENDLKTIVLAGRPYHVDPEINHGIDKLISSLGLVLVSEDSIANLGVNPKVHVLNQWTYHARMYRAASFVAAQKHTQLVQLVSFGCGIDAVTTDEMSELLRTKNKLYTQIKIDEINNLGAVKIRLRSLLAAMNEQ